MRDNKNYRSVLFLPDAKLKIRKKIAIKLKKWKYAIIASFQAKIGWKRPRKNKKKNLSFNSVPTRRVIENSKKIAKKFKKLKNTIMASFQTKKVGKARERENIKIIVPFRSNPKRNRKIKKK